MNLSAITQITTAKIADGAVTALKLAEGAVEVTKLAPGVGTVPVGAVMQFAMNAVPTGWLAANGAELLKTAYSSLLGAIGTTYGETNGSGGAGTTHFRVPDLRGYFVRGFGTNADGTVSAAFGVRQVDAFKSHTHTGTTAAVDNHSHTLGFKIATSRRHGTYTGTDDFTNFEQGTGNEKTSSNGEHSHSVSITANTDGGDTETRPNNIAMLYCIKF